MFGLCLLKQADSSQAAAAVGAEPREAPLDRRRDIDLRRGTCYQLPGSVCPFWSAIYHVSMVLGLDTSTTMSCAPGPSAGICPREAYVS